MIKVTLYRAISAATMLFALPTVLAAQYLPVNNPTFTGTLTGPTLSVGNNTSIGPRYDVTQYGAYGTGYATTGSISMSSTSLTVGSVTGFSVGQIIVVPGAGASGANLTASITNIAGSVLTLSSAASTTVSAATIDDTAGVQAAFNACWNSVGVHGGVVEFPGNHTYVVSATINAYDLCQIEGVVASATYNNLPTIAWNGPPLGAAYTITDFTAAANTTPVYAPSSPTPVKQPYIITFTATNSLAAGNWVDIENLGTAAGLGLNRTIAQVASATGTMFTVVVPFAPTLGTFSDSGTATPANVVVAFDANARYEESVSNIQIKNWAAPQINPFNVGFYFGSAVDTGTHVLNAQVSGATEYSYYFANGGINMDFDKGWRSDGAGIGAIYFKSGGAPSNFGVANGTVDNYLDAAATASINSGTGVVTGLTITNTGTGYSSPPAITFTGGGCSSCATATAVVTNGAVTGYTALSPGVGYTSTPTVSIAPPTSGSGSSFVLDNSTCNAQVHFTARNVKLEVNTSISANEGVFQMYDCPNNLEGGPQFLLDLENTWETINVVPNFPSFVMSPANDAALSLTIANGQFPSQDTSDSYHSPRFVGLPQLSRQDMTGSVGYIPFLTYANSFNSQFKSDYTPSGFNTPLQLSGG
jgi:hypothetical protein